MAKPKDTGPPGPDIFAQRALNWELYAEMEGYACLDLPADLEASIRAVCDGVDTDAKLQRCFDGYNRKIFLYGADAGEAFLDQERKKLSATLADRRRAQLRVVVSNIALAFLVGGVTAVGTVVLERLTM